MMLRVVLFVSGVLLIGIQGIAQDIPSDFLPAEFHAARREAVREMMPANSVAVFFANAVRNRANDVDYIYHQDPNFYYLTGYREPNAVLLVFSEKQSTSKGSAFDEVLYVQERDPQAEQWNGKRLGVEGAKAKLGFEMAFNGSEFSGTSVDFKDFDTVLFFDFKNDYRNTGDGADIFDLITDFKKKADYPSDYDPDKQRLYSMIKSTNIENSANVAQTLGRYLNRDENLKNDALLSGFVNAPDDALRSEIKDKIVLQLEANNLNSVLLGEIMATLRETKTKEEMVLLKKAIEISAVGQIEVMKAMHPNMSETEIQGVHEYVYKKYGAEYEGYPSIVGGETMVVFYIISKIISPRSAMIWC